jgi:hypothetical protein
VLEGVNTYAGATTINGGALLVNGSLSASSAVAVNSGGTLGGTGTVAALATVVSGGTMNPGGPAAGTLTLSGGLNLASGAALDLELGTSPDLLAITGGTFTGPAAGTVDLNISIGTGFGNGTYTLLDWTGATPSSVDLADFALTMPNDSFNGVLSIDGSTLLLAVEASKPSIFRFR